MFKTTTKNSPIFIIDGKPKVVRSKKGRRQSAYPGNGGCLFGFLIMFTSSDVVGMLFLLFVATLLFIMIGISFVLWLLPLFLMKGWAFKRSPRPPGALPVFFLVLALTILPGTLGLDGLNKQDGWNWFHLYENTVARIFPEHHTDSVSLGYGVVPAWLAWFGYRIWLFYSDWKVVKDYKRNSRRLSFTYPI